MAKQILGKVQGPAGYSPKVELNKTGDMTIIAHWFIGEYAS